MDPVIAEIRRKLKSKGVKVATIIERCRQLDRNNDDIVHVDDLEDVIQQCLGEHKLTTREIHRLFSSLSFDKKRGNVEYLKLSSILEPMKTPSKASAEEKWHDSPDDEPDSRDIKSGSVGEFLQRGACPAEIKNFKRLIAALERFERDSGMKLAPTDDGFVVPLGPDLRASIKFFMS